MRFLVDECTVAAVAVNFRVVSVASSQLSIVFSGILPIDSKYLIENFIHSFPRTTDNDQRIAVFSLQNFVAFYLDILGQFTKYELLFGVTRLGLKVISLPSEYAVKFRGFIKSPQS